MKAILLLLITCSAQIANSQTYSKLSVHQIKKLDSLSTQDVPPQAPGVAVAIIQNGKVIFEKYAGYASLPDSIKINSSTRFNIASNGKQFTAVAILQLIALKKLKLTDDIRTWFPQLYTSVKDKITIQNLLTHTSGIRDCYDLWALQGLTWWEQSFNNSHVLQLIENQRELNFKPGTQFLYSNSNYILLALIIEKLTAQPFTKYTNDLFAKLNMHNTSFVTNYTTLQEPIAKAYFNFNTWTTYDWIWNVCGDGNLFSSMEDQIQWEMLIQKKAESKIDKTIIRQSQSLPKDVSFAQYGYGLQTGEYKKQPYQFHEGATGAWKASVIRFPKWHTSILVFTNSGKAIPYQLSRQLADVIFNFDKESNATQHKPEKAGKFISEDELSGVYLTDNDFAFVIENRNNALYLKRIGRNDVELVREADNIFHQKYDSTFKQEFIVDENNTIKLTVYHTTHAPYSLTKTKPIAQPYTFNQINGTYYNEETNVYVTLTHKLNNQYEVSSGEEKISNGLLVSESKMLVNSYTLQIIENGFLLNGERIRQVKFIKVPTTR